MNILVTLNSAYIHPLTVMLKSLMLSNPDTFFDIYIGHSSLTAEDFQKIREVIDSNRVTLHPIKITAGMLKGAPILKRTSKETYYRLLMCEYLPEELDRILYIDPDTVIINSLDELYNLPLDGYVLAGSTHMTKLTNKFNLVRLGLNRKSQYINAGVILVNLNLMRKSVTVQDIFNFITENSKRLPLADQDVINVLFDRKIFYFDAKKFNLDERTCRHFSKIVDKNWIDKNAVIIHFNGSMKPWKPDYKGILKPYYDYYENINPRKEMYENK